MQPCNFIMFDFYFYTAYAAHATIVLFKFADRFESIYMHTIYALDYRDFLLKISVYTIVNGYAAYRSALTKLNAYFISTYHATL